LLEAIDRQDSGAYNRAVKVLVLGGYGTFGLRLCRLLAVDPRITLAVAGRSHALADAARQSLPRAREHEALALDRDGVLSQALLAVKPDVFVDATGPYQAYGDDRYRVVAACIAHGVNYLDFADDAAFVAGVDALDARASANGVYALSGVSSFPVLTAAVVRHLAWNMQRVRTISAGIAPSPYAFFGRNVIHAISLYAGKPIELTRGGRISVGHALVETRRYTIAPPGALPLRDTRFSLAEVPDLRLLPPAWPGLEEIWIGVGPVPEVLHRMLNGLARLVQWRVLPSLRPFADLFHAVINKVRWGEHRGGMFVDVQGEDATGAPVQRSWHLLAEGDAGPLIPCLAIDAVLRKHLEGDLPAPGARAATDALEIEDYSPAFDRLGISRGIRRDESGGGSIFQRLLGAAWDALPAPVRALHDTRPHLRLSGRATVTRGEGRLARLVAKVAGFPEAGTDVPVEVSLQRDADGETWIRDFAGKAFSSRIDAGRGRSQWLLRERFGPARFHLALVPAGDCLQFIVRGWDLLGIPLPRAWAPAGDSYETAREGRFVFHIEIAHPWIGPIVAYEGWLDPR
jgi:hypothetical protein